MTQLALTMLLLLLVVVLQAGANALRAPHQVPAASVPLIGRWSNAGAMDVGRVLDTASLLQNGNVLIVGGAWRRNGTREANSLPLDTAEVYDPSTNTWSAGASMPTRRAEHTALVLADGRLLVIGGYGLKGTLGSAEIYDPVVNSWASAGHMAVTRIGFSATLMGDGRVLIAGGQAAHFGTGYPPALATAEIFDPRNNSWSEARSLGQPRWGHSATLLRNGKVLVVGGGTSQRGETLPTTELYDPDLNSWSPGPSMNVDREGHMAMLLPNGDVFVVGGMQGGVLLTDPEVFDVRGERWTPVANAQDGAGAGFTATHLGDGRILLVGGIGAGRHAQFGRFGMIYDSRTNSWSPIALPPTARMYPTATLLRNGKVLVAGGFGDQGGTVNEAELFDPTIKTEGGATHSAPSSMPPSTLTLATIAGLLAVAAGAIALWRRRRTS